MKRFYLILSLGVLFFSQSIESLAEKRYAGGDISLLPEYEKAGAIYKDQSGKKINEVLPYFYEIGMNAMRVRLFVDPDGYISTHPDADKNACQSLEYIIPLCKRIQDVGMSLMLDFHYSDTWADPGAQWTPSAWSSLSEKELIKRIGEYTAEVLNQLKAEGIMPQFIQPGNEISYGMLWGEKGSSSLQQVWPGSNKNWARFASILKSAIASCKEVCPDAEIVIHSERTGHNDVLGEFYNKMAENGVEYDIIGLSYYPYFHCPLSGLESSLTYLEKKFSDKPIMIVETGYPYKWAIPGSTVNVDYTYSLAGQNSFAKDLVATLEKHENVTGLFWWWMEYNAFNTSLSGWYNAPLFDSTTGKATPALKTIASFAKYDSGVDLTLGNSETTAMDYYTLCGIPAGNEKTKLKPGFYATPRGTLLITK